MVVENSSPNGLLAVCRTRRLRIRAFVVIGPEMQRVSDMQTALGSPPAYNRSRPVKFLKAALVTGDYQHR